MCLWIVNDFITSSIYKHNFFCSILFRSFFSFVTSFFISLSIGYYLIAKFHDKNYFQIIRSDGPKSHKLKRNIPTMGGIMILLSIFFSLIIWGNLSDLQIWYVLFIFVAYGILGLIDDLLKINRKNSVGLKKSHKLFWQSFIALMLIIVILICKCNNIHVLSDFCNFSMKKLILQFDFWGILLSYLVLVSTSNAVNLSDGLDGLSVMPVIFVALGLAIVTWISSNIYYANYFHILHIFYVRELMIICATIIGSGLGFLWFNSYPAQIFMGDTGSLSYGGAIGLIAVLLHQEFLLLIMGGLFVIESLSVILQVGCFKIFKIRMFKMAPIHHHFELKGYLEPKIVVRSWIISFMLMCLSLMIFIIKK